MFFQLPQVRAVAYADNGSIREHVPHDGRHNKKMMRNNDIRLKDSFRLFQTTAERGTIDSYPLIRHFTVDSRRIRHFVTHSGNGKRQAIRIKLYGEDH